MTLVYPNVKTPEEAVSRAYRYVNRGMYTLGTGNRDYSGGPSDCAGYSPCYSYDLPRHQPGFNKGAWATVEDDINTDSILEDAANRRELFYFPSFPARGDLLVYHTIRLEGHPHPWIGHVGLIVNVPHNFVPGLGQWHRVDVIQCRGPNGARPGIVCTDGSVWDHHDSVWGHEQDGTFRPDRISKAVRVRLGPVSAGSVV